MIKQEETEKKANCKYRRKRKISLKTMNTVFSVDDFPDPFWVAPASDAAAGMSRSQSVWAFERFLEEFSGAGVAIPGSCAGDNVIGPSLVAPQSSVSKAEEGDGNGDVVEIKKPNNQNHNHPPSDPIPTFPIDSDEYRAILKNKLDQACGAVALSRVFFSLQSPFFQLNLLFYIIIQVILGIYFLPKKF